MNEPDSMGIRWEPSDGKPGARELYISTMDALHQLSPTGWLYMIEGTGQNSFGLNWVRHMEGLRLGARTIASWLLQPKYHTAQLPHFQLPE